MLTSAIAVFMVSALGASAATCTNAGSTSLQLTSGESSSVSATSVGFGPAKDSAGNLVLQTATDETDTPSLDLFTCSDAESTPVSSFVTTSKATKCLTISALENTTATLHLAGCIPGSATQSFQFWNDDDTGAFPLVFMGSRAAPTTDNTDYSLAVNKDGIVEIFYAPFQVSPPPDEPIFTYLAVQPPS